MIHKRAIAKLRAQDWFAIAIELAIVIVGVFIGNWVNDWREAQNRKHEVAGLVDRLKPVLTHQSQLVADELKYYANARNYALTAFAGWKRDPKVSDAQFVIAAYQASQITGFAVNSQITSTVIGADQVREIDDAALRDAMTIVLGTDSTQMSYQNVLTEYRQHVRELIPDSIQERIRASCGDENTADGTVALPPTCDIPLPAPDVAQAAASLRAHPELVHELDYHLAQASTLEANIGRYGERTRHLLNMIDSKRR